MKILIAPDSFKGSLSSREVAHIIEKELQGFGFETIPFPMADGGEGTSDVLKSNPLFEEIIVDSFDSLNRPIKSSFLLFENRIPIIELALTSGLLLLNENERNPLLTSTYGTGLVIKQVIDQGYQEIVLTLGGSATNDGGMGILVALGARFFDQNHDLLLPNGENLHFIKSVDFEAVKKILQGVKIIFASDVENVLFGENGATQVYGQQKGATNTDLDFLERSMIHYASVMGQEAKVDFSLSIGSGAAGGAAFGLMPFCDFEFKNGVELIGDWLGLDAKIAQCDFVITGEGKIDNQTLNGKLISRILDKCLLYEKPVLVLVGAIAKDLNQKLFTERGVKAIVSLSNEEVDVPTAIFHAKELLKERTRELIRAFLLPHNPKK